MPHKTSRMGQRAGMSPEPGSTSSVAATGKNRGSGCTRAASAHRVIVGHQSEPKEAQWKRLLARR